MTPIEEMNTKVTLLGMIYKSGNVDATSAVKQLEILMGAVKPADAATPAKPAENRE